MGGRKVLLIEDDTTLGELLLLCLARQDQVELNWFLRARLAGKNIVLMDIKGQETVFEPEILKGTFDFAFVDYRLKMSDMTGLEVTRKLSSTGLKVIASSGLFTLNEEMVKAGATSALSKDLIISRSIKEPDFIEKLCAAL